jgi:hypothetical protein
MHWFTTANVHIVYIRLFQWWKHHFWSRLKCLFLVYSPSFHPQFSIKIQDYTETCLVCLEQMLTYECCVFTVIRCRFFAEVTSFQLNVLAFTFSTYTQNISICNGLHDVYGW